MLCTHTHLCLWTRWERHFMHGEMTLIKFREWFYFSVIGRGTCLTLIMYHLISHWACRWYQVTPPHNGVFLDEESWPISTAVPPINNHFAAMSLKHFSWGLGLLVECEGLVAPSTKWSQGVCSIFTLPSSCQCHCHFLRYQRHATYPLHHDTTAPTHGMPVHVPRCARDKWNSSCRCPDVWAGSRH